MGQAKNGDTVKVHYTGKLADGTVFDASVQGDPLEFTLGERDVIRGFEQAVLGMQAGETKTVRIAPQEAYGPHRAELVFEVGRDSFPPDVTPEVGEYFEFQQPDGRRVALTVTKISESSVTLDANHPLAGKELTFDVELVEIVPT